MQIVIAGYVDVILKACFYSEKISIYEA